MKVDKLNEQGEYYHFCQNIKGNGVIVDHLVRKIKLPSNLPLIF